ncbi:MAG TPA: 2,3-diaminopropionate biosynthesis protein SbnA [Pyrinomonadaceae bacterium]|jgi:cysteine synthase A
MNVGILSTVGRTPLVELTRVFPDAPVRLYAKLESFNPGGSSKDRPASFIIREGLADGTIRPDTVVVESSSGNMGIGLAQACSYYGLRFICVIDPKTTAQNRQILRTYGAELDLVSAPDPETGEFLQSRINRVRELQGKHRHTFWPNQYENRHNAAAHQQTMGEIVEALDGDVDYLFCSTSTCGTLRGCAEQIRGRNLKTRVVAVDALGSVIFGGEKARRLIPGHGAAVRPALFQHDMAERVVLVSDLDCVVGCRRLVRREAILAGGSSGGVLTAFGRVMGELPRGSKCVLILPDRGERYLDTIYSDEWVEAQFGDVQHLWNPKEADECELELVA